MLSQVGGSKTDTLIKLVLIFCISLLSFSVGTFVGKKFSDSQHKQMALETDFNHAVAAYNQGTPDGEDARQPASEDSLTDEDIAKLDKEFGSLKKEEKAKPVAQEIVKKDAEQPKAVQEAITAIQKVADRVAKGQTPTVEKKKVVSRIPSSLPAGVAAGSVGKYTIQISSHLAEKEAVSKVERLRGKGVSAFYIPAKVKGNTWYRVSIGIFKTKRAAHKERASILSIDGIQSAIVQKIVK